MEKITNNRLYENLFDPSQLPSKCTLGLTGELCERGHIIPALVMRWLKQASKKNTFIYNDTESDKVADTISFKFLCEVCEDRFSKLEKYFTDQYFKKYYRNQLEVNPDDKVYEFALSVAWRLITSQTFMKNSATIGSTFRRFADGARDFFMNPSVDSELSVYVMYASEIETNVPAEAIQLNNLRYSIQHSLVAHPIFLGSTGMRMTLGNIPLVYFKLGVFYFVVTLAGYFDQIPFSMSCAKTGEKHRIFSVSYTDGYIGFLQWISKGRLAEAHITTPQKHYDRRG